MASLSEMDAAARARRALGLSLWTAAVVLTVGSGAVAARIATFDGSVLTQVDRRQDPHKLFPDTQAVERETLDVRPPVVDNTHFASVWPAADAPPPEAAPVESVKGPASEMAYVTEDAREAEAIAEATRPRALPGVIECAETCYDAHQAATDTVETVGGDTTSLPAVTPDSAASPETVALDDLLPRR